jgi:Protein of unknown function (DUF551)
VQVDVEWIPVREQLPETKTNVLWFRNSEGQISHWSPLLKSPIAGEAI